jgi:hypothetical protein
MATGYREFPDHPLRNVPDEILAEARKVLQGAVVWKNVDAEAADPIADAVVVALLPWINW